MTFHSSLRWLLLSACLAACACSSPTANDAAPAKRLTILHTNDHHGRFWANKQGEFGMAARQTLLLRLRAQAEQNGSQVLLLSGGDINTGVPESDLQLAEPDFKAMKMLGYDAMALGNHEFDNPRLVLDQQREWAEFPFLSANIIDKETGQPAYQPYALFNRNGLKIAVVGLTTVDTAIIGNREYIGQLDFRPPAPITAQLVAQLRQTEQPDIVLALTHMGHYEDGNHGINAPGDVALARQLPSGTLDAIIGGHSQEPVCMDAQGNLDTNFRPGASCKPDRQNGTWIMQAHEWGKYVGRAEFEWQAGQLTLLSYQLIPVNLKITEVDAKGTKVRRLAEPAIVPDPELLNFLTPFQERGAQRLRQPVADLVGRLEGDRNIVRFQQTNLGQLITAAQMSKVSADLGVLSSGGIRHSIEPGAVSLRDILQVQPFSNRLVYIDMPGSALEKYLQRVATYPPDSGAYPQFNGVTFSLRDGAVENLRIQGKPLNHQRNYRLSTNSFNGSGGDGYPPLDKLPGFVATDFVDANVLADYLRDNSPINAEDYRPKN